MSFPTGITGSAILRPFLNRETGQDLTEYALMLAFVVLGATGIFLVNGNSLYSIWVTANGIVNQAAAQTHAS